MLILLPPSRTKHRADSGKPMSPADLSFPTLTPLRTRIAEVLIAESARPFATATLRISPSYADEVASNTRLFTDPAVPARELYAGTLYRALDLPSLTGPARRRAAHWVVIASALYGALRPGDRVAAYRLSMNSPLPLLAPLATRWRDPLGEVLPAAAGNGLLVDCRAGAYAAAWHPRGAQCARWVRVRVDGRSGPAKHTQGLLVRHLLEDAVDAQTPQDLADYLSRHFEVGLSRRERGTSEWVLDIMPVADDSDHSRTRPAPRHPTTV